MRILNISIPDTWQSLNDDQLFFVFSLLTKDLSASQIKTHFLLKMGGIKVLNRIGAAFIVEHDKQKFTISALQIAEALTALAWLDGIPQYPVRLRNIRNNKPVHATLQGVAFGDYLILDNLYQGYIHTKRNDLLRQMAEILYNAEGITLSPPEEISIFYWFASVKLFFANTFTHFFKQTDDSEAPALAIGKQLQELMNNQIRALTGGDITKEREVLEMDCWRALTELNAKARDAEDIKRLYKK